MPGSPQLVCPPAGFIEVDLSAIIPSNMILPNSTSPFTVTATMTTGGVVAAFLVGFPIPFVFTVYYESFGGGPEGVLGTVPSNFNAGFVPSVICVSPTTFDYALSLTVPMGTLPPGQTFRFTGVITSPFPISAHNEGPIISTT